jgi:hypothetical protein
MFLIYVEPLVSILFTERLADNEALIISGVQKWCYTKGYSNEFEFYSDRVD